MHEEFIGIVKAYYRQHGRTLLPWRPPVLPLKHDNLDPYAILLSEVMLQQTQVSRVVEKYSDFLKRWPTIEEAAQASQKAILQVWQSLGYNRRALYLHQTLKNLQQYKKWDLELLLAQKGIGENTAKAVLVYAYNQPHVFIETNIRTTFIHHFFEDRTDVADTELLPHIESTLDSKNSREWYWALMDYGSHLKKIHKGLGTKSKHYKKQSIFAGSKRQLRASVVRELLKKQQSKEELKSMFNDERLDGVLDDLIKERFIKKRGKYYSVIE